MSYCPGCDSPELEWFVSTRNTSGVVDGRLRLNEVGVDLVLGCKECSMTVRVVDAQSNDGMKLLDYIPPMAERPVKTVEVTL